jgi:hypothetical protein
VDGLPNAVPARLAVSGAGITALAMGWSGATPQPLFAEAALSTDKARVSAPLQVGGMGAALADASGALSHVVTDDPAQRRQVAGIVPQASYKVVGVGSAAQLLQAAGVQAAPAGTARPTVVAVICGG